MLGVADLVDGAIVLYGEAGREPCVPSCFLAKVMHELRERGEIRTQAPII